MSAQIKVCKTNIFSMFKNKLGSFNHLGLWRLAGNRTSKTTNMSERLSEVIFAGYKQDLWNQREPHISPENWRCICLRWNWILSRQEMCFCVQSKEQLTDSWWKTYQNQSNLGRDDSHSRRQWHTNSETIFPAKAIGSRISVMLLLFEDLNLLKNKVWICF